MIEPYYQNSRVTIYNADCMKVLEQMPDDSVDLVLTSPPYKSTRICGTNNDVLSHKTMTDKNKRKTLMNTRYDEFVDERTDEEYVDDTVRLFNEFDRVLKPNCIVLYNISWGSDLKMNGLEVYTDTKHAIFHRTPFYVADIIAWKKKAASPNNESRNMCTRIWEPVWVCCRRSERATFRSNKRVTSVRENNNQTLYEVWWNWISASNNDGATDLNKCTYSTEFCTTLLNMYADQQMRDEGGVVFDPYNGTGTTGAACLKQTGLRYIGAEISKAQCDYSAKRLDGDIQTEFQF